MPKLVFNFKSKDTKKIKIPKNILGGKGANLSEMGRMQMLLWVLKVTILKN